MLKKMAVKSVILLAFLPIFWWRFVGSGYLFDILTNLGLLVLQAFANKSSLVSRCMAAPAAIFVPKESEVQLIGEVLAALAEKFFYSSPIPV